MMKGQIAGLMKQAQQMQENLKKAQEEIALMEIEGQAGAGLVNAVPALMSLTHRQLSFWEVTADNDRWVSARRTDLGLGLLTDLAMGMVSSRTGRSGSTSR